MANSATKATPSLPPTTRVKTAKATASTSTTTSPPSPSAMTPTTTTACTASTTAGTTTTNSPPSLTAATANGWHKAARHPCEYRGIEPAPTVLFLQYLRGAAFIPSDTPQVRHSHKTPSRASLFGSGGGRKNHAGVSPATSPSLSSICPSPAKRDKSWFPAYSSHSGSTSTAHRTRNAFACACNHATSCGSSRCRLLLSAACTSSCARC